MNPNKVEDGCIWMVQDISARKQAEARLRESEQQLAIAEEIGRTGSWAYNIATDEFWASTEARRIFAFPPGSARIPIEDVEGCIPERERVHQALVDLVNGVNEYTLEYSINPADGSAPKVISSIAKLERDALGKPLSVHGFIQDISERHQAVLALRQQEEFAHATIDGLSANICVIDAQGIIVTTNRAWDIFAAENSAREGTFGEGVCYLDVCQVPSATEQAGDNDLVAGIRAVLDGSLSEFVKEYPCHSPDVERWFSCRVNLFAVSGLKYAVISHENITERKLAEERLERSLKEKTVMLKEIHHRVKNNMQVVYSLLNLQARGITDPVTRAMFEESRNRVMSMAMIHENLYRADDLAFIDFNKYLRGLTAEIVETYQRPGVSIVVDQESLPLDINVGIPCGLIANELVSNSLKYAFPEGSKGEIRLGINKNSSGDNVLTVEDNGIGFPVALDFRKTASLGLELVNVLTDQIHGTIELQAEHGTKFSITFPDKPTKKSQFP